MTDDGRRQRASEDALVIVGLASHCLPTAQSTVMISAQSSGLALRADPRIAECGGDFLAARQSENDAQAFADFGTDGSIVLIINMARMRHGSTSCKGNVFWFQSLRAGVEGANARRSQPVLRSARTERSGSLVP